MTVEPMTPWQLDLFGFALVCFAWAVVLLSSTLGELGPLGVLLNILLPLDIVLFWRQIGRRVSR